MRYALGLLLLGCGGAAKLEVGQELALEVEGFRLTEARAAERAGAGGGRVVLFESERSRAEARVTLETGRYEVTVVLDGPDRDHDAVFVALEKDEYRVYPDAGDRGRLSPAADRLEMCVPQAGPVAISLRTAETGVALDRVVLKRLP